WATQAAFADQAELNTSTVSDLFGHILGENKLEDEEKSTRLALTRYTTACEHLGLALRGTVTVRPSEANAEFGYAPAAPAARDHHLWSLAAAVGRALHARPRPVPELAVKASRRLLGLHLGFLYGLRDPVKLDQIVDRFLRIALAAPDVVERD